MATGQLGQGPWAATLGQPPAGGDGGGGGVTSVTATAPITVDQPDGDVTIGISLVALAGVGLTWNGAALDNDLSTGVAGGQVLIGGTGAGDGLIVRASSSTNRGVTDFQAGSAGTQRVAKFTAGNTVVTTPIVEIDASAAGVSAQATLKLRGGAGSLTGGLRVDSAGSTSVYSDSTNQHYFINGDTTEQWMHCQAVGGLFARWLGAGSDTNGLTFDRTNKRLGIGTAAPGVPLEVTGLAGSTQVLGTATTNTWVIRSTAGTGVAQLQLEGQSGAANFCFLTANAAATAGNTFGITSADRVFLRASGGDLGIGTSTANFVMFAVNDAEVARLTTTANLLIGTTTDAAARLRVQGGATVASAAGAAWNNVDVMAATVTLTGTTTVTRLANVAIAAPSIAGTGPVTVSDAASLYIGNAPSSSGGVTLSRAYSLWIDNGTPRIDSVTANGVQLMALGLTGPAAANGTPQEWLIVNVNGVDRYIPLF